MLVIIIESSCIGMVVNEWEESLFMLLWTMVGSAVVILNSTYEANQGYEK